MPGVPRAGKTVARFVQPGYNETVELLARRYDLSMKPASENRAKRGPVGRKLAVAWEGAQFVHHSLALVNREVCLELIGSGHELSLIPSEPDRFDPEIDPRYRQLAARIRAPLSRAPDVLVRHRWPFDPQPPAAGRWVMVQPWEFGSLPLGWLPILRDQADEVWTYTHWLRDCCVQSGVPAEKVFVTPLGIDPSTFHPGATRLDLPTRKRFRFLFVGGTIARKGADLLVDAYLKVFTAKDDVCLVIKDFGSKDIYRAGTLVHRIREAQSNSTAPEIVYLDADLPPADLPRLYAACNCLVHPYRGEGFGLPVLEAMACGLAVIVTAGGATDDFATPGLVRHIPATRTNLGRTIDDFRLVGDGWLLAPDPTAIATLMASVVADAGAARQLGQKASAHVRRHWTWAKSATLIAERLEHLARLPSPPLRFCPLARPTRLQRKPETPPIARLGALHEAEELVRKGELLSAWNACRAAIHVRPFHPDAYLLMAQIATEVGDQPAAAECARRLAAMTPGWTLAHRAIDKLSANAPVPAVTVQLPPLPATTETPRLSVCLIVKNEAQLLERCLNSVRAVASQIVVVDTGSTDGTIAIARRFGAEVFHFPWNDSFADARNVAHEHARGDWALILDADEELPPESQARLEQDLAAPNVLAYRLPIRNQEDAPEEGVNYVPRLFRNAPGLYFVGRIHEQIYTTALAQQTRWGMQAALGTALIIHHGYTPELIASRDKVKRNLNLLTRAIEETPNDPSLLLSYGLELANDGQFERALELFRDAMLCLESLPVARIVPEVRERLLTALGRELFRAGRYEELLHVMRSRLARDAGLTASLEYLTGLTLFRLNRPADAIPCLRACVEKKHLPVLSPLCREILRGDLFHLLAQCFWQTGQAAEAVVQFEAALKIEPDNPAIICDYARLLHERGRSLDAMQRLHHATDAGQNDERLWYTGAFIASGQPELIQLAVAWTGSALAACPRHPGIRGFRAEALLKSGQFAAALELFDSDRAENSLGGEAAVILCRLATDLPIHPILPARQAAVGREFFHWYLRLLECKSKSAILAINARIDVLRRVLPDVAALLEKLAADAAGRSATLPTNEAIPGSREAGALSSETQPPLEPVQADPSERSTAPTWRPSAAPTPVRQVGSLDSSLGSLRAGDWRVAWNSAVEAVHQRPFHPEAFLQMFKAAQAGGQLALARECRRWLSEAVPRWTGTKEPSAAHAPPPVAAADPSWLALPPMPERPRLSVCLIAKDEEEFIAQCLASIRPVATQIVLVDTGSSDRTREIAAQYGAEVYRFPWNDNFSDARNFGLAYARGDWVLILDADETLPTASHAQLWEDLSAREVAGYRLPIINQLGGHDEATFVPRLFRNLPGIAFANRIHEEAFSSLDVRAEQFGLETRLGTATIVHYGNLPEVVQRRGKVQRNLRLLEQAITEQPDDPALRLGFAIDLVNDGRREKGLEQFRFAYQALERWPRNQRNPELRERLVTLYGIHLLESGVYPELVEIMRSPLAVECGPTASQHYLAAYGLARTGKPGLAIEQLLACLAKRDRPTLTPPYREIGAASPRHLLALCYAQTDRPEDALTEFKSALQIAPENASLIHDMALFRLQQSHADDALAILQHAFSKGIRDESLTRLHASIKAMLDARPTSAPRTAPPVES